MILSVIISAVVILIVMYFVTHKGQTPLNLILRASDDEKKNEKPDETVKPKKSNETEDDKTKCSIVENRKKRKRNTVWIIF